MSSSSPFSSLNATCSLHCIPHNQVHNQHPPSLAFPVPKPSSLLLFPKSHHHLRVLSPSPSSLDYGLKESRWLRGEQWWLCKEWRRFHEKQRWARKKESLLGKIARLKLRIQALECEIQIPGGDHGEVASVATLLQERNLIVERGLSASLVLLEEKEEEAMDEKEIAVGKSCYGIKR
ncbi:hypothetical protein NL676_020387 [Syzygium grande]|nr:hypothetical protein NL676_020387 [Syzygium grande]